TRFAEDLEAVADAEHEPARLRMARYGLHDRGEAGDRATAQVVAIRESARQHDAVDVAQVLLLVPDRDGVVAEDAIRHAEHGMVVVRPGERHHTPAHGYAPPSTISTRKSSITPFASSCSHIAWTRAVAAARSTSRRRSSTYLPTRTSPTSGNPSTCNDCCTALPCGSRMPRLGVTTTRASSPACPPIRPRSRRCGGRPPGRPPRRRRGRGGSGPCRACARCSCPRACTCRGR